MSEPASHQSAPSAELRPKSKPWQGRFLTAFILVVFVILALVLPPLINISRYQKRITELVSHSFGRPVHLSGVELRLLPRPGFVVHDLTVAEDPSYGVEPVLSARTVVADVDLVQLWRGKLQVSRVNVDEASLNIVRNESGRWNLEALMVGPAQPMLTGAAGSGLAARNAGFPYLEATNSRINLKQGYVKSPFSLANADLSLWQENPGEWRLRLVGQPQRTDTELSFEVDNGTGELRVEGTLHSAPQLRSMPIKLDMEWRDAQLGQLSRLMLGSDAGWRGGLVADIHVEGTTEAASTKARLRASEVRRAEFAPESSLDFDSNCSFVYQHSINAFHQVGCDTAIGSGHLQLKAELPGAGVASNATLAVNNLPVQAGLDLLRTLRRGFAPGIEARGTVNGSLSWERVPAAAPVAAPVRKGRHGTAEKDAPTLPLAGTLTVDGVELRGGQLKEPLVFPKMTWSPALAADGRVALASKVTLPLDGAGAAGAPGTTAGQALTLRGTLSLAGYDVGLAGGGETERLRQLAYAMGLAPRDDADGFAGGTAEIDLTGNGLWTPDPLSTAATDDALLGSVEMHHTRWQAPWLRHPLDLAQAGVTIAGDNITLTSEFTYGTLKGGLTATAPTGCAQGDENELPEAGCAPQIQLRFPALDAGALQVALLGAPEAKSLLSPLMDRMRSADKVAWPQTDFMVSADSLVLGPVTVHKANAKLHQHNGTLTIDGLDADLLGGHTHVSGELSANGDLVDYSLTISASDLNPAQVGQLRGGGWTGQTLSASGRVELTGATAHDLAAAAKGTLDFDWKRGGVNPELARFEHWSGTATLAGGALQLGANQLTQAGHSLTVKGSIPLSGPAKLSVSTGNRGLPAER